MTDWKKLEHAMKFYMAFARDGIEDGTPWYQPQGYAVAAKQDLDDAARRIRDGGLDDKVVEIAVAAIRVASGMQVYPENEAYFLDVACEMEERWKGLKAAA